ncbi:MAG: hypothetical protein ACI4M6_04390 [Christensenellaceae bacterium]
MSVKRCQKCNSIIPDGDVCPCCSANVHEEEITGSYLKDLPKHSSLVNVCFLMAINVSFVLLMINAVTGKTLWAPYPIMVLLGLCALVNALCSKSIKKFVSKLRNGLFILQFVAWIVGAVLIISKRNNTQLDWIFSYFTPLSSVAMILFIMVVTFLGKIDLKSVIGSLVLYLFVTAVPLLYLLFIKISQITPMPDLAFPDQLAVIIMTSAFGVTFLSLVDIGYIYLTNYKEFPENK